MESKLKYLIESCVRNFLLKEISRKTLRYAYEVCPEERRESFRRNVMDRNQKLPPENGGAQVLGHYRGSYYDREKVRYALQSLSKSVKKGKPRSINLAAKLLSEIMAPNALLIPIPQSTGRADYTLKMANAIKALRPDCQVLDILSSDAREQLYTMKKKNPNLTNVNLGFKAIPSVEFKHLLPKYPNVYLLDNVIDTGMTYIQSRRVIKELMGIEPRMLAISATPRSQKMKKVLVWFENFLDEPPPWVRRH